MALPGVSLAVAGNVRIQNGRALLELAWGSQDVDLQTESAQGGAARPPQLVEIVSQIRDGQTESAQGGSARPPQPVEIVRRIRDGSLAAAPSKQRLTSAQISSYIFSVQRALNLRTGIAAGGWSPEAQARFNAWLLAEKRGRVSQAPAAAPLALPAPPVTEQLALLDSSPPPAPQLALLDSPAPPAPEDDRGSNRNSSSDSSDSSSGSSSDEDSEPKEPEVEEADVHEDSDPKEPDVEEADEDDILLSQLEPLDLVGELEDIVNDSPDHRHYNHMIRLVKLLKERL